jgi:hypothetical protein
MKFQTPEGRLMTEKQRILAEQEIKSANTQILTIILAEGVK